MRPAAARVPPSIQRLIDLRWGETGTHADVGQEFGSRRYALEMYQAAGASTEPEHPCQRRAGPLPQGAESNVELAPLRPP